MNWKKFKEEKPSEGEEVLAYHPSWIDEDFNPRGIRIGFWNGGDDFKSAHWWDYQDFMEFLRNVAADIWVEYTEPKQRSKLFNLMNKKNENSF